MMSLQLCLAISFFSIPAGPTSPRRSQATGLFLTQFRTSTLGFLIRPLSPVGVQQRILRLSNGHLRENERERERSAVHLAEDYPLKGKGRRWRWRREGEKKDVLKRWMQSGRMEGERGQMSHVEIKCEWERVNRKARREIRKRGESLNEKAEMEVR